MKKISPVDEDLEAGGGRRHADGSTAAHGGTAADGKSTSSTRKAWLDKKEYEDFDTFKEVLQRQLTLVKENKETDDEKTLFFSHCWRDTQMQVLKRLLVMTLAKENHTYWADWFELQAKGPLPWRKEIEEGIETCAKFILFVDYEYLLSFNCLQEVAFAQEHGKPMVVVLMDQRAMDLLVQPNGAQLAWDSSLKNFEGKELTPGFGGDRPLTYQELRRLYTSLSNINFCMCRPLDFENEGDTAVLERLKEFVSKELAYEKEHAHLLNRVSAWIARDRIRDRLLQGNEVTEVALWIQVADKAGQQPPPTESMREYIATSTREQKMAKRVRRILQIVVFVVVCIAAIVSGILYAEADIQRKDAREQRADALAQREQADVARAAAEVAAEKARVAEVVALAAEDEALQAAGEAKLQREQADVARSAAEASATEAQEQREKAESEQRRAEDNARQAQIESAESTARLLLFSALYDPNPDGIPQLALKEALSLSANATPSFHHGVLEDEMQYALGMSLGSVGYTTAREYTKKAQKPCGHRFNVAWSPDGRYIATAGLPHNGGSTFCNVSGIGLEVFDAETGERAFTFDLGGESIRSTDGQVNAFVAVDWSPDSKSLATGSSDNKVRVWDLEKGTPRTLGQHVHEVAEFGGRNGNQPTNCGRFGNDFNSWACAPDVKWSPDGRYVASGSKSDRVVRLWEVETGDSWELEADGRGDTSGVHSVAWSPDGRRLASGSDDGTTCVWDLQTRTWWVLEDEGHPQASNAAITSAVNWSPDGTRLSTADGNTYGFVWTLSQDLLNYERPGGATQSVEGKWIFANGRALQSGAMEVASYYAIPGAGAASRGSPTWSPDGRYIASSSYTFGTLLVNVETNSFMILTSFAESDTYGASAGGGWANAWSPDGGTLVITDQNVLRMWSVEPAPSRVLRGATVGHSELSGGSGGAQFLRWSPDGTRLAVNYIYAGGGWPAVRVWDVATGTFQGKWWEEEGTSANSVAWSPDGRTVAFALFSGEGVSKTLPTRDVILWDVEADTTRKLSVPVSGGGGCGSGGVNFRQGCLAYSPDGRWLAAGSQDGSVYIFDVEEGTWEKLEGHTEPCVRGGGYIYDNEVVALAWSPDGRYLATTSMQDNERLRVRTVEEGASWISAGHTWFINDLSEIKVARRTCAVYGGGLKWSPDSRRIAGTCGQRSVKVWDVESGNATESLRVSDHNTNCGTNCQPFDVTWSPDGRYLASVSGYRSGWQSKLHVWDVDRSEGFMLIEQEANLDVLLNHAGDTTITAIGASVEFSPALSGQAGGHLAMGAGGDVIMINASIMSMLDSPAERLKELFDRQSKGFTTEQMQEHYRLTN